MQELSFAGGYKVARNVLQLTECGDFTEKLT